MSKLPNLELIKQINEHCGRCGENEEYSVLTPDEMKEIAYYAKMMARERGIDLAEAIGLQLEDVPGIEGMDFEELIGQILKHV